MARISYWIKVPLISVLLIVISIVGWVAWFSVSFGMNAKEAHNSFQALQRAQSPNLDVMGAHVKAVSASVERMRSDLSYIRFISYIPLLGTEYRVADEALYSAEIAMEAGETILSVLREAGIETKHITHVIQDKEVAEAVVGAFQERRQHLLGLAERAEYHIKKRREQSNIESLEETYSRIHHLAESVPSVLYASARLDEEHLRMLGYSGLKRYLVVFQNAHELRSGGGLISMYGILDLEFGSIVNFDVAHVSKLRPAGKLEDYPVAPKPLYDFVAPHLYFYNSNWDAHPGVWTENAFRLWHQGHPEEPVDGIVVAGTPLLEDLVDLFGPIVLGEVSSPLTGENVVEATDWVSIEAQEQGEAKGSEKAVLQHLVDELQRSMERSSLESFMHIPSIILNRNAARDFFVYLPDEGISEHLGVLSSRNGLPDTEGDEFFLLGTNLGSAKGDLYMRRFVDIAVDASVPSSAFTRAVITYDYQSAKPDARTWPYNAHVRTLLPLGTPLPLFAGFQGDISKDVESGRAVYGSYLFVNFGEKYTVEMKYDLTPSVREDLASGVYSLVIRKQGGVEPNYSVSIRLPNDWEHVDMSATYGDIEIKEEGNQRTVYWEEPLMRDVEITLVRQ